MEDPLILRIIDHKDNSIKKTYVFVGDVDELVQIELNNISNNTKVNESILVKYYGDNWRKILCVSVKGGEDFELFDEEFVKKYDINQIDIFNETETKSNISTNAKVIYVNIFIYNFDNIFEVKQKISVACGIPVYRQHLWYNFNKNTYPLYYSINMYDHTNISVNINNIINFYCGEKPKELTSVDNLPINMNLYQNKDFIKIVAQDTFMLYGEIKRMYDVNELFVIDLNDIVSPNDIFTKYSNNLYQLNLLYYGFIIIYFPMITLSIFTDYIKNEDNLPLIYPELVPKKLKERFKLEDEIYHSAQHIKNKEKLYSSITSTNIENSYKFSNVDFINIRSLFDFLELDDIYCYSIANIKLNDKVFIFKKSYLGEKEMFDKIPINSILIKIKINKNSDEYIKFLLYESGDYNVNTTWREEQYMSFDKIKEIVIKYTNILIDKINNLNSKIKTKPLDLIKMYSNSITFKETNITFFYDDDVSESKFSELKLIIEDFKLSNILSPKESEKYEFFFRKGMYRYDVSRLDKLISVNNYYEYLSNSVIKQKWDTIFNNTRLFSISNLTSKIKIVISGLSNNIEMNVFEHYLKSLICLYEERKVNLNNDKSNNNKNIKTLKVLDPVLYNPRKSSSESNMIYSKICQKPYQPQLLSDAEYNDLPKEKKDYALKYWNFTTEKPVWYSCPNVKYPNIKFIIGEHPKNYCIPCCKKMAIDENVNEVKQEIHKACMSNHCYTGEKINLIKGSHYIASYGKIIEAGRICRLPEKTLEPLFFNTYSTKGIDVECSNADGYYLFGIEQNLLNIKYIGILHVISHALNLSIEQFIKETIIKLKDYPDRYRSLLNGQIHVYFNNLNNLIESISSLNSGLVNEYEFWNELFIQISFYYFGISIVLFEDKSKEEIFLHIPSGLKSPDEMFPISHKNIVVIKFLERYYPVYLINTDIFKKTGIIETKLFTYDSGLISIIRAIISNTFVKSINEINLSNIGKIIKNKEWFISERFINSNNLCYAITVKKNNIKVYLPISDSYYQINSEITSRYDCLDIKELNTYNDLLIFLQDFPMFKILKFIQLNNKFIGCILLDSYVYFKEEDISINKKNIGVQILIYHPLKINKIIYTNKQNVLPENYKKELIAAKYEYYLFPIFIIKLNSIFDKNKNTIQRNKLLEFLNNIYKKDKENFKQWLSEQTKKDNDKIKLMISNYMAKHNDKKILFNEVNNTIYDFDKVILNKIRKSNNIESELENICDKFVKIVNDINYKDLPNILYDEVIPKIELTKKRYKDIISILSNLIVDESKWDIVSIRLKYIDFFRFIIRDKETIKLETE